MGGMPIPAKSVLGFLSNLTSDNGVARLVGHVSRALPTTEPITENRVGRHGTNQPRLPNY
jgi:hypothetical protein